MFNLVALDLTWASVNPPYNAIDSLVYVLGLT